LQCDIILGRESGWMIEHGESVENRRCDAGITASRCVFAGVYPEIGRQNQNRNVRKDMRRLRR
jgi:hypothetical protein